LFSRAECARKQKKGSKKETFIQQIFGRDATIVLKLKIQQIHRFPASNSILTGIANT
jgi:hypothetical protein